jgi:hypothetical protein
VSGATGDPLAGNLNHHDHLKFLLPSGAGGAPSNQGGVTPNFGGGNGHNPPQLQGLQGTPDLTSFDHLVQLLKFGSNGSGNGGGQHTPQPHLFGGIGQLENGGNSSLQNLAQVPNPSTHKHH